VPLADLMALASWEALAEVTINTMPRGIHTMERHHTAVRLGELRWVANLSFGMYRHDGILESKTLHIFHNKALEYHKTFNHTITFLSNSFSALPNNNFRGSIAGGLHCSHVITIP
jgi:hypothetical protein